MVNLSSASIFVEAVALVSLCSLQQFLLRFERLSFPREWNVFEREREGGRAREGERKRETDLEKMRKTQRTNYNNFHSWYLGVWFDYPHSIAVLCHGLHSRREIK